PSAAWSMRRYASRADVRLEDPPGVRRRQHHVRPVLPRFELPIDLVGCGIVARDLPVRFGGEVQLAGDERQAVRAAERRDVDATQLFLRGDVDHRNRVTRRWTRAVVAGE